MKKFLIGLLIVILVAAGAAAALGYNYLKSDDYASDTLPDHYTLNGVNCSNMTYAEAAKVLTNKWNHREFKIVDANEQVLATYSSFGCAYNLKSQLATLKKDHFVMAGLNHYLHTPVNVDLKTTVRSCGNDFKERIMDADFMKPQEGTTITADAYVDLKDPDFAIVPEVYGSNVDTQKVFDAVIAKISSDDLTLVFNEADYYAQPKVLADDPELTQYQTFCKEHLGQKITYDMGKYSFTISVEDLGTFFTEDGSGDLQDKNIKKYVSAMADKYNNVGIKRTIKTFAGKKVTVKGGTYGWIIDTKAETSQLKEDLKAGKDVKRKPKYSVEGYTAYMNGIGDTYIDVDLTQQKVRLYIKGQKKFSCSVVTGDKSKGKATPEGTFYVRNKLRDVTMRGTNADGTKYAVPAKYWMGVTTNGIGLHDSNWRTEFGGDIWKTNGSHGCINMPKDKIKGMYDQVKVGMPVIMHY